MTVKISIITFLNKKDSVAIDVEAVTAKVAAEEALLARNKLFDKYFLEKKK